MGINFFKMSKVRKICIVFTACFILQSLHSIFIAVSLPVNSSHKISETDILPDYSRLIDLKNFEFLNRSDCGSRSLVAVVHSAPGNFFRRRAIRSTWGRDVHVAFMIGKTNDSNIQIQIKQEIERYNDIVQGSFVDSYRNLTYKHVMSLKWAIYHCPNVEIILKTDDDTLVNSKSLMKHIDLIWPPRARNSLLCSVGRKRHAPRGYRHKWRVSLTEYPERYFPQYCIGWVIVYSLDVAFKLYVEAQRSPFFWIDDIFMTGIVAAKLNISHTHIRHPLKLVGSEVNKYQKADFLFALPYPNEFLSLWNKTTLL